MGGLLSSVKQRRNKEEAENTIPKAAKKQKKKSDGSKAKRNGKPDKKEKHHSEGNKKQKAKKSEKVRKSEKSDAASTSSVKQFIQLDVEWSHANGSERSSIDGISNRKLSNAFAAEFSASDFQRDPSSARASRAVKRRKISSESHSRTTSMVTGVDYIDDYDTYYNGKRRRRSSRLSTKKRINYKE